MERRDDFEIPYTIGDRLLAQKTANEVVLIGQTIKTMSKHIQDATTSTTTRLEAVETKSKVIIGVGKLLAWAIGLTAIIVGIAKAF